MRNLRTPAFTRVMIPLAIVASILGACMPNFESGDFVEARVGRIKGDPCRVMITLMRSQGPDSPAALVARLETPACVGGAK